MFVVFSHIQHVATIFEDRLLFYRESSANTYDVIPYFISNFIIQIPTSFINVLIFSLIIYNMANFYPSIEHFLFFFGCLYLCSITGLFMCHFVGNISPDSQTSLAILPIFMVSTLMLAGYIVLIPNLPIYIRLWAPYLSFMRWSFQALVLNEFYNNNYLPLGNYYIDNFNFNNPNKSICLSILIFYVFIYMILCFLALKYKRFESR